MMHLPEDFRWIYKAYVTKINDDLSIDINIDLGFNNVTKTTFVLHLAKSKNECFNDLLSNICKILLNKQIILESIKQNDFYYYKIWLKKKHPNSDKYYMEYIGSNIEHNLLNQIRNEEPHLDRRQPRRN